MLCGAEVAVGSEINTKRTDTEGQICRFKNFQPVGARNQ